MDQTAIGDAETWLDLAEIMTFPTIEAATPKIETPSPEAAAAPETIEAAPAEPRTARVLSISQLRQKLGIEDAAPIARAPQPSADRPRIVRRRAEPERLAG